MSATGRSDPTVPPAVVAAVGLVSATGLAAEIVLMRIFSIIEWHQFAWMIISLALLGFGASGTLLVLLRDRALRHRTALTVAIPALAGVTLVTSLSVATRIEWRSLELLWNPAQTGNLLVIYLLLSVPFCCIGTFIGLTFMSWPAEIGRLYGADLVGAAAGAVLAIVLLRVAPPEVSWLMIASLALLASVVTGMALRPPMLLIPAGFAIVVAAVHLILPAKIEPGEYKAVSQALRVPGAQIVETRSGPHGLLQLLENERVPLRLAPGLSLNYFEELPLQRGVFVDGEGPVILNGTREPLDHVDRSTFGAVLVLEREIRSALVAGVEGMPELTRLAQRGTGDLILVEDDPELTRLVAELGSWGGSTLADTRIVDGQLRPALADLERPLDLLFLPFASGESLDPDPGVTVQAFRQMRQHLGYDGLLAVTSPVETPPRNVPVLLAAIAESLERDRLDPRRHVAALRGWDAATILVSPNPLSEGDVKRLRQFAIDGSFDLVWVPDIEPSETNRFNRLDEPWHFEMASEILAGPERRAALISRYKFDIRPPTDDRPWFGIAMRWSTLGELMRLRDEGGAALIRTGYPLLIVTLAQALLAGIALILLPLTLLRSGETGRALSPLRIVTTFVSLGLGFLFVEIAYIHRLTLLLGRPLEATTIVLASFLFFTGLGSLASAEWRERVTKNGAGSVLVRSCILVAIIALVEIPVLALGAGFLLEMPHALRSLFCVVLIAPLAFTMGVPFPTALALVRAHRSEQWIAWAWGINGCASVVSAVLAVLLAIHVGLLGVTIAAAALYVIAGLGLGGGRTAGPMPDPLPDILSRSGRTE